MISKAGLEFGGFRIIARQSSFFYTFYYKSPNFFGLFYTTFYPLKGKIRENVLINYRRMTGTLMQHHIFYCPT